MDIAAKKKGCREHRWRAQGRGAHHVPGPPGLLKVGDHDPLHGALALHAGRGAHQGELRLVPGLHLQMRTQPRRRRPWGDRWGHSSRGGPPSRTYLHTERAAMDDGPGDLVHRVPIAHHNDGRGVAHKGSETKAFGQAQLHAAPNQTRRKVVCVRKTLQQIATATKGRVGTLLGACRQRGALPSGEGVPGRPAGWRHTAPRGTHSVASTGGQAHPTHSWDPLQQRQRTRTWTSQA